MKTLRELTDDILQIMAMAEDPDIPQEALADTLEGMEGLFQDKAQRVGMVVLDYKAKAEAIKAEIARLTDRKRAMENNARYLEGYLINAMQAAQIKRIEGELVTINLPKPRSVVVIDNEGALPVDFLVEKTTVTPDKKGIAIAIKAGDDVPGAHIEDGKQGVTIK